jgi:hypothetical protein
VHDLAVGDDIMKNVKIASRFAKPEFRRSGKAAEEANRFGDHLFSLRHRSKVSDLSDEAKRVPIPHPERFTHWSAKGARSARVPVAKRADTTEAARKASITPRQASADRRDAEISDLQREKASC